VRIEGDYRPRQIDSADVVAADASDPAPAPLTLLSNEDVAISRRRQAMPYSDNLLLVVEAPQPVRLCEPERVE
jgi:hypothetical protein